ncbi:MAG: ABC transporter permease [Flavobacterium sp.]
MIIKLVWKNIWHKPLHTILSIILLSSSVAIISLLILIQNQFENQFSKNLDDIDMVLGAQGSPLQLILSAIYQIDAPTGNIKYEEAKTWMRHPFVKKSIPLAFGDNYLGYKIVGTTSDYLNHFEVKIAQGKPFSQDFEVVLGSEIAQKLNLKLGDTFVGAHGDSAEGHVHESHPYKIVGIASKTGKVMDHLILCTIPSVWKVHEDESTASASEREITAVLIKFKSKMAFITWPRLIPQNTKMQGALPIIEINRLFSLFGIGLSALQYLALGILIISGLSIFIALYNKLKERQSEFALMRISGASKKLLFISLLLESLTLCFLGFLFGTIIGRLGLQFISLSTENEFKMAFNPFEILWKKELILLTLVIILGLVAALIPAIKAYFINISKTLSNG